MAEVCRHTVRAFEAAGFQGFRTFEALDGTKFDDVPDIGGVYVILRTSPKPPTFRSISTGGRFKGRDPSVPVGRLAERWTIGCELAYVGKGEHLRTRLRQFSEFGLGKPVGHWGGRYIWQLADSAELLVAWKQADDPRGAERELISDYDTTHGRLPFANLRR